MMPVRDPGVPIPCGLRSTGLIHYIQVKSRHDNGSQKDMKTMIRQDPGPRRQNAIMLLARLPELQRSVPDEPYASLPWEELDQLSVALLGDLAEVALGVPGADVIVCCREAEKSHDLSQIFRDQIRTVFFPDAPVSATVAAMLEYASDLQYQRIILVLNPAPRRTSAEFQNMFARLNGEDECIVLAATPDGYCSLLGLRSTHRSIFQAGEGNLFEKPDGLLAHLCDQSVVLCPAPPDTLLNSGYMIARLRDQVADAGDDLPGYPKRTAAVFRQLDKKYRVRRP